MTSVCRVRRVVDAVVWSFAASTVLAVVDVFVVLFSTTTVSVGVTIVDIVVDSRSRRRCGIVCDRPGDGENFGIDVGDSRTAAQ